MLYKAGLGLEPVEQAIRASDASLYMAGDAAKQASRIKLLGATGPQGTAAFMRSGSWAEFGKDITPVWGSIRGWQRASTACGR